MNGRELIKKELDEMRAVLKGARERLAQLQSEVEQLAGAVAFGEYLLEQLPEEDNRAKEESDDSSS